MEIKIDIYHRHPHSPMKDMKHIVLDDADIEAAAMRKADEQWHGVEDWFDISVTNDKVVT